MAERIIIVLDVTNDEAEAIAEKIAGVGPHYGEWNLPIALDLTADAPPSVEVKYIMLRSDASAALGGAAIKVAKDID